MKADQLIDDLSNDLQPVERLASPVRRAVYWFLASTVFIVGYLFLHGVRPDFSQVSSDLNFWIETLAVGAVAIIAMTGAFLLSIPGSNQKAVLIRWFVGIPVVIWVFQLGLRYFVFTPVDARPEFHWGGAMCSANLTLVAVVPALLFLLMMRRAAPVLLGWVGALALTGVAAVGAIALQFCCPMSTVSHVFTWHLLPVLAFSCLGVFLGNRLLRW